MQLDTEHVTIAAAVSIISIVATAMWNAFRVGKRLGEMLTELRTIRDELHAIRERVDKAHERIDTHLEKGSA